MKFWGSKTEKVAGTKGLACIAAAGASHGELLREALNALAREGSADRVGIWIETEQGSDGQSEASGGFRGLAWDREIAGMPREWAHLSVEAPLPEVLVLGGRSVEQDLAGDPQQTIIGPLVGLRRVLWVPVQSKGQMRGIILAGNRKNHPVMFRERAEEVAAELALALQLEETQRIARAKNVDLGFARMVLKDLSGESSVEKVLSNLAGSCVSMAAHQDGLGAAFAVIGVLPEPSGKSGGSDGIEFQWRSGDEAWMRTIESEPLASVWRRALETRRVAGSEPPLSWAQGVVARVVAFPLESEGRLLGTLVAGFPGGKASLAALERLELRAALAASALGLRNRKMEESRQTDRQRQLIESSSEALILLDESGGIVAASRAARELTGKALAGEGARPAGIPPREHFAKLFRGRDREGVQAWLQRSLGNEPAMRSAGADSLQGELCNEVSVRVRMATPAGGWGYVILLDPRTACQGPGQGSRAETELQSVLEWLEEGVVLFDAQENVRAMNTRFEQIVGLSPEESGTIRTLEGLIRRLEEQAAEPQSFAARWRDLARGIEGGMREELQMMRPVPRILERAARPVLDAIGRQLGRVEIYRDLTAQRVFQSKLLQTEKLAALGQMVSGVAHELSNPLTSILGYAQRLLVRQDVSVREEEVRQIYQEAERASTILRQLLQNARETLPERRLVSLNQTVLQAMELQRFSLAAEKIRVEIDLEPVLPFVYGDAGHLQQVLMNLVGNARQAIEHQGQGGTIRLRTKRIGEQRVQLEVQDTGPGIPSAILARIFDPFFTTKPPGIGTGLGLAIVLSIVREHGGQVQVVSPPQGGALFQIELPAAAEALLQKENKGSESEGKESLLYDAAPAAGWRNRSASSYANGGARVLVVEDEPTVARLIADVLEDEGLQVDMLLDGREALERAERESYDLVICDMKMPGLDGQRFYKSLARSGSPLRERFLFVTGDVVSAHTHEFLRQNQLPHVAKPFRVEELTEKVHRVLESKVPPGPTAVSQKNVAGNG